MHIKTPLQILNALDKIQISDEEGSNLRLEIKELILKKVEANFPELEIFYKDGRGFTSGKKKRTVIYES